MADNADQVPAANVPAWLRPVLHAVGYGLFGAAGALGGGYAATPADAADVAAMEERITGEIDDLQDEMEAVRKAFWELRVQLAARTGSDLAKPDN